MNTVLKVCDVDSLSARLHVLQVAFNKEVNSSVRVSDGTIFLVFRYPFSLNLLKFP